MQEHYKKQILDGLIALRKAGKFQAVWCDQDKLSVRYEQFGDPEHISWQEAATLTGVAFPAEPSAPRKEPYFQRWTPKTSHWKRA